MEKKYQKLFEPTSIGKLQLKNRTSMAPMGLVCYADVNGGFNEEAQNYYIERAKGGVGLIITGICSVNYKELPEQALPCPTYNPLMFCKSTAPMVEKIHAYDSKILLQLTGGLGRSAMPQFIKEAYAPSPNSNRFDPRIQHRELTTEEVKLMIQDFVKSAAIAKQAGFDGVEIHAVHEGYLLDQFAITLFNQRTDEFGGDLAGRLKFATDIVQGIKHICGQDFTVSIRYSLKSFMKGLRQGALPNEEFTEVGRDYEEGIAAAKLLVASGYDALNVDVGTYDSWYWNHPPMYFEDGMYRPFGQMLKDEVDVPIILAGRMDNPDIAIDALENCCDIIAYGRPLLADAYLVDKIRMGTLDEIRPCLSCHDGCMGRIAHGLPLSCAVNPACGREVSYGLTKTDTPEHILIIGGGVAGMEAARVCATCGHKVTLVEASDKLGGNLIPGGMPKFKKDDHKLIQWYEKQMKNLDIAIKMEQVADEAFVKQIDADKIIIATGSKPNTLTFEDHPHVVSAEDVLLKKVKVGQNVAVIGGGLVGCELALDLAQSGTTVTIIERENDILGGPHGMPFMNYDMLKDLLNYENVTIHTGVNIERTTTNGLSITGNDETHEIVADTIVTAVGYKANNTLSQNLQYMDVPIYTIGDARRVKNIMFAIWDAYEVARSL